MKPIILSIFVLLAAASANAQSAQKDLEATTTDGRIVVLKADGTWTEKPIAKGVRLGVTLAGFAALSKGMSYADAIAILGREGEILSDSDAFDVRTVAYSWNGDKGTPGSYLNLVFQGGKLESKSHAGLK